MNIDSSTINGWLNVFKEQGYTSSHIVRTLKKRFDIKNFLRLLRMNFPIILDTTYQHLMPLQEKHVFQLPFGQLVTFMQLSLFHLPDCCFALSHQLLFLLQKLSVQKGNFFSVRVTQPSQLILMSITQFGKIKFFLNTIRLRIS